MNCIACVCVVFLMWFGVCDIIKAGYFYFLCPHSAVVLLLYSLMVHQLRADAAVRLYVFI